MMVNLRKIFSIIDYLMMDKKSFFQTVDSFLDKIIFGKKDNEYHLRHTVNLDGIDD